MKSVGPLNLTEGKRDPLLVDQLTDGGVTLHRCFQCGTCTASCPAAAAMDLSPRRMWRMVHLGLTDEVLRSKTMWLCSMCYRCQVRCPRGIPLTDLITRLKERALAEGLVPSVESSAFYEAFATVMRRYGRMRDVEFMARYLLSSNLVAALGFAPLGLTLLRRGKLHLEVPSLAGEGRLDRLFERVSELESEA